MPTARNTRKSWRTFWIVRGVRWVRARSARIPIVSLARSWNFTRNSCQLHHSFMEVQWKFILKHQTGTATLRNHPAASSIETGGPNVTLDLKEVPHKLWLRRVRWRWWQSSHLRKRFAEIVTVSETFSGDLEVLIRVFVTLLERAAHGGKLVVSDQSGRRVTRRTPLTQSLRMKQESRETRYNGIVDGWYRTCCPSSRSTWWRYFSSIRQIATLNQQFTLDLKEKTKGWPAIIYTADTFEHFAAKI